ncbi:MAG TPA: hypothetical protein VI911_12110 [Patescibacteria group bacterium]|nr:hypothetical protein [Patescibacteria group bacterium]
MKKYIGHVAIYSDPLIPVGLIPYRIEDFEERWIGYDLHIFITLHSIPLNKIVALQSIRLISDYKPEQIVEHTDSYITTIESVVYKGLDVFEYRVIQANSSDGSKFVATYTAQDIADTIKRGKAPIDLFMCHNQCSHPNKREVHLITSKYLYCPDCKQDLGDI